MRYCLLVFSLFCCISVIAQTPVTSHVLSPEGALGKFREDYPQEKVYLQTDRDQYIAGETIWMKAWCTTESIPGLLSRILYIDLVNSEGTVVAKKMYRLDSLGSTPADFDLPASVKSGNYSVNAYTLWMLNFPDFIYRKNIFVYNSDFLKSARKPEKPVLQVQFFPEGGQLIEGIKNRVAFVATDEKGFPVNVKGHITDNTGKTVADMESEHNGMGTFEIEPATGISYRANIPAPNGSSLTFRLPEAQKEGIALRVENTNPNRLFVLLSRAEANKDPYNKLHVVAQMNYQVVAAADLNFDEGRTAMPISKKNLPPGIMQITVFNESGMPLAERLAFIETYKVASPRLSTDTLNTRPRGRNIFSFTLDSLNGAASLAVAVTNASLDGNSNQADNIVSYNLLGSDLKGYIHQPGYYVKDKSSVTLHHADLLMMINGWRRYEWKKITQGAFTTLKYPVESAISLRGSVRKSDRNAVVKDGHVAFIIKSDDSTTIMADARVTDKGEFLVSDLDFKKSAAVAYQGTNNRSEGFIVDVDLHPAYIDSLKKSPNRSQVDLDTTDLAARKNKLAAYLYGRMAFIDTLGTGFLGNVTVTGVRKKLRPEDSLNLEYANGVFQQLGKSIDPGEVKYATSIWQVIQRTIPGVDVSGDPYNPKVTFTRFRGLDALSENNSASYLNASGSSEEDFGTMLYEKNGVAYFLNEVNVSMDVISSINVNDVALIKVLKTEASALGASGAAIAIYTRKGTVAGRAVYEKRFTTEKRQGYALVKSFFSPDYSLNPGIALPDNRFTLYWNPFIRPAKNGKYKIEFYNSDNNSSFKVNIQGLSKEGRLISFEKILQ